MEVYKFSKFEPNQATYSQNRVGEIFKGEGRTTNNLPCVQSKQERLTYVICSAHALDV